MNIESTSINRSQDIKTTKSSSSNTSNSVSFAEELREETLKDVKPEKTEETEQGVVTETQKEEEKSTQTVETEENNSETKSNEKNLNEAINGLNSIVKEFNQSEDKLSGLIKNENDSADNDNMINNEFNIQENKDIMPQMSPNMNFSGNGQPFSSFMNNDAEQQNSRGYLGATAQDLAEEKAILSTMAENIAIANKNQALKDSRIIMNEEGVKKINSQTGIKIESVVKFDTIIMNQADVEVFVNLVENGVVDINSLTTKSAEKGVQISKTLADMLAKSMETNQPVRINFDNDISVIIRISRDGKITADFLPSSQVAEAYLKENLPLLKQRFDDNNIEYESLNQRERRNPEKENNKKKGRNNE